MVRAPLVISPRTLETADTVRYEFDLRHADDAWRETLFYEFPRALAPAPTGTSDGVLCALVLHAMAARRDIQLRGAATRAILRNLEEFQLAWSRWLPRVYQPIAIAVDEVVDEPRVPAPRAIAGFSGGADSSFTLLRHAPGAGPSRYAVDAVLLVHGFDVSLSNPGALDELIARTQAIRDASGVQLRIIRTNSKELRLQDWEHSFAAQLAACMHFFAGEFTHALIGSSEPYDALVLPWGSNPVTDHLLSGGALAMVHDGAAFSRTDKIALLAQHPAAMQSLKVCWEGRQQGRNCGVCEKCVRTQLNFLAVGVPDPPCFDRPLDLDLIPRIAIGNDALLAEFQSVLAYAERREITADWVRLLRNRVRKGKRNWTLKGQVKTSLAKVGLLDTASRVKEALIGHQGARTRA